jgi:hypothetical protein
MLGSAKIEPGNAAEEFVLEYFRQTGIKEFDGRALREEKWRKEGRSRGLDGKIGERRPRSMNQH